MKKGIPVAAALTLCLAGQAAEKPLPAEQLFTPTLWAPASDKFACNLTNIDRVAHTVQLRIITNGKILLDSGSLIPRLRLARQGAVF
jgi:hypothetical protein